MPAMEVETVVSHKKSKKSKKMKKEVVEDEQEEVEAIEEESAVVDGDEAANGLKKELKQIIEEGVTEEDEDLMKKSKKKKAKKGGADENGHDTEANGNGHAADAAAMPFVDEESINKAVKQIQEVSEEILAQFKTHAESSPKRIRATPCRLWRLP